MVGASADRTSRQKSIAYGPLLAALAILGGPDRALAQGGPAPRRVTVTGVGDILFARYLPDKTHYSPTMKVPNPFAHVLDLLQGSDLTFGNLEGPMMEEPKRFGVYGRFTFRSDPARGKTLAETGFDAVSLANNHIHNLGAIGAPLSVANVEAAGVRTAGAGATAHDSYRPVLLERNGYRIAFLAWTTETNGRPPVRPEGAFAVLTAKDFVDTTTRAIRASRDYLGADFVIVSLHWGIEYQPRPTSWQRQWAHAMVDAGADLVLGHHPHVIQDFERYHGAVIAYSLGNFLFDNPAIDQRQCAILLATLEGEGPLRRVSEATIVPILSAPDEFMPRRASGAGYRAWRKRLDKVLGGIAVAPDPAPPAPRPPALEAGATPARP